MRKRTIEFSLGVFLILACLALAFLCVKVIGYEVGGKGIGPTYEVSAYFDNVGNLHIGAPVRVAGVVVGKVTGITLDSQSYRAKVILRLQEKYHFPRDSVASILTMGVLGEQYVGLEMGADTDSLKEGGVIPITNSALILEDIVHKTIAHVLDQPRS